MYQTPSTLWSLRRAILNEKFFTIFNYIDKNSLTGSNGRREGYAAFTPVDDHIKFSTLDDSIKEYERLNIKDFNISIVEYLTMPLDIRNQLLETIRSISQEKIRDMGEIVNNPMNSKPFG